MRKLAVVVALGALVALTLTSCDLNEAQYTGKAGGKKVVIIGDQVTSGSGAAIHLALDPTFQVRVIALDNMTVAELQATADTLAATDPDVVIINAGTNDMLDPSITATQTLVGLLTMSLKFSNADCVALTSINTIATTAGYDQAKAAAVNAGLDSAPLVIPWNNYVNSDPDDFAVAPEHLLPTPDGSTVLAADFRDTAVACTTTGGG